MLGLVQAKAYLYAKITADTDLATLMDGVRIYDIVQEDAVLPYITYGNISSKLSHILDSEVTEHIVKFIIVAKADSSLTTHNIMARLEQIFDGFAPSEDLTAGFMLVTNELLSTGIEQVNFDNVKGQMDLKLLIEGDV